MPRPTTDGLVTIRPPVPGDAARLVAGRDDEFHRFLGDGSETPEPVGCIIVGGAVIGWVDWDTDREWLEPGEVNLGYSVFGPHRDRGYASRAVQLLMHQLAVDTAHHTATLLIDPRNERSLALAQRLRFPRDDDLDGLPYFKRPVPPLEYTDGVVTIRRQRLEDVDDHLASIDDAQIDWLWLAGQRQAWEAMSPGERRVHLGQVLHSNHDTFRTGPKWAFAVDGPSAPYVAYVDCDLTNEHVPHGEANVSYSSHPGHRGLGYVSRAVRLVLDFLRDHTGAREAHLIVDTENTPSRRVAASVGAVEVQRWSNEHGRTMIRHVVALRAR